MLTSFNELSVFCQGLINLWLTVLMLSTVLILIIGFRSKRSYPLIFRNCMLILKFLITFAMYQLGTSLLLDNLYNTGFIGAVEFYGGIPVIIILAACLMLTAIEYQLWHRVHIWEKEHITKSSIKEAIDSLPSGICVYEDYGLVILKNDAMDRIYSLMTGDVLRNGLDFSEVLKHADCLTAEGNRFVIGLSDGSVRSFAMDEIDNDGRKLRLITAQDVTEEYARITVLKEKKAMLEELNTRLTAYSRDMVSVITSREILNAKIKIHDELGSGLLAIKHYLMTAGDDSEKKQIIERIKRNADFLNQETEDIPQDEYLLMMSTAKTLGVSVVIDGKLPDAEPYKHITATGIHECFTNILRHARGNMMFIRVTETDSSTTVEFTNNGEQPSTEITEKGGLSSLRTITEEAGGSMTIISVPEFRLIISLPKELEKYAL